MNESRSSVNYVESTSSSPRSDRRDMDSVDRRRYRGYVSLCVEESLFLHMKYHSFKRGCHKTGNGHQG